MMSGKLPCPHQLFLLDNLSHALLDSSANDGLQHHFDLILKVSTIEYIGEYKEHI